ncbi:Ribonuclease H-like superfamily protein with integrase and retrovirus zinc finger-like domains [Klebsormidium nitens]|uniref:Ribonuclease H-like superfamily protein with integrase and retrovirus zinc finger-like domains n=1 Tax=Klebsormidium nitens TaxID=105231 RepID=A0A1Y1IX22_KLENI|nr:Ribonuclease H-like superfamily protein with integrase and retrovirus zinc finger-like domains [Klebsormidium nitens]|eukprot:GAQ92818.1 Ribonuclease H-like superfamily protein with integrase and retrovirus zinc finger-like domains [Klebsormidium nitens]
MTYPLAVLAGLSSRFEGVVTVLTTTKKDPVKELLPTMQVFEQGHGLLGEQDSGASSSATAVAYVAKGGNFAGKGKGGPGKAFMVSHRCGKLGHFANECRSGAWEPEKPKTGKKCYTCRRSDQLKKDCPKKEEIGGRQGIAFVAEEGAENGRWIVDSGASQHMNGDKVSENLFSVKKATALGAEVVFRGKVCEVFMDGEVVFQAEENAEGISMGCQPKPTWEDTCLLVREAESPVLWHRRLGHAGYENLSKMVEGGSVRGVGVKAEAFRKKRTSLCAPCIIGKQTREPFHTESDSKASKEPLELVHMDVCGPMPVTSKGGRRYLATFLDDYSKLLVVQPLKRKSDVTAVTESVFARLELQSGKKVKGVETDRGGEYVNEGMTSLLGKRGTVHRTSAGHSPEQNGSAEWLNRTLEERAQDLPEDAGLGPELWAEATVTANYTRNRVPSSVHGKTPPTPARTNFRERDGRVLTSRDVIVDERGPSKIFELGPDPGKEEGRARGPSRVNPPTRMGVEATLTKEADTQPGVGATPTGEADTGSEDSVEGDGAQEEAARRYPARKRGAPGEWF